MINSSLIRNNFYGIGLFVVTWKWTVSLSTSSQVYYKENNNLFKRKLPSKSFKESSAVQNNNNVGNTVFDEYKHWLKIFHESGIPEPDLSSRYIIQHVLNVTKAYEFDMNMKRELSEEEEGHIKKLCECRLARMPVQYIIKEWEFRDLRLIMTPPVFIPRPETEQLVELVVERAVPNSRILEIGCGSGAICLSLSKALPEAQITAIDQSKLACQLTEKNAELNKLTTNLKVVHSKLQEDGKLSQPVDLDDRPVDIIVSNPPYVPYAQLLDLQPEIKLYEDLRALEAGRDGLRVVRSLLTFASSTLPSGGLVFLEVDSSHPLLIQKYITAHPELNIKFVRSFRDFCDKDRFVELEKL